MALTDQRTTSVKAVQLVSGSLYQITRVANGISLEAQVKTIGIPCRCKLCVTCVHA